MEDIGLGIIDIDGYCDAVGGFELESDGRAEGGLIDGVFEPESDGRAEGVGEVIADGIELGAFV